MISITTILSFAVVLLAASSYSAPIDIQPDSSNSKVNVKKSNEQPVVTEPVFNKESTSVSNDHKDRSSEEKDSDEMTTKDFTRPPRGFQIQESSEFTTEMIPHQSRKSEEKDSDEMTTESFTRPPREVEGKESDEMTTEPIKHQARAVESKESDEITTEPMKHRARALESKESDEMTTESFTRPSRGSDNKESDEMTTEVFTRPPRGSDSKESDEMTTEMFTQSPRSFSEDTFPSTTEESKKRTTVEEFLYTTLESSKQFNQRAIRPVESQEDMESSSPFPLNKKKSIDEEPASSVQTFGKSTGLLKDETNDQSNEEVTKTSQFPDTITVIPDQMIETKIYTKSPSNKSVLVEPAEQEQLSQVQDQSNIKKTKPNN